MVVLGISGFETSSASLDRHAFGGGPISAEGHLEFESGRIPFQFFPLGLIGHDPAAAILVDGRLVACAAEERFSRIKHGFNLAGRTVLPRLAIRYCLAEAGLTAKDVDCWAHYCRFTPQSVASRLRRVTSGLDEKRTALVTEEYRRAYTDRLAEQVLHRQLEIIADQAIPDSAVVRVPHHVAHLSGAFYSSGFEEAACLTLDGYGEEESSAWAVGSPARISTQGSIRLPTSLGMLYQIVTGYLGFRHFGDEYKVMGLSAYGRPNAFRSVFEDVVELGEYGGYSTSPIARPDRQG